MKSVHTIISIILLCCLFACDRQSDDIIPKRKMEDVLYDYHIAQGIIANIPYDQREQSQKYIEAVFEKYEVTEAQFDSSLVYYNRNIEDIQDIYKHLQTRFEALDASLQLQGGSSEMRTVYTLGGDTTDIWTGKKLLILRSNQYLNKESFVIKADTAFHLNDQFKLVADLDFIREDMNNHNNNITACIAIHYKNGKTVSSVQQSNIPDNIELTVNAIDNKEIKTISGYFLFMSEMTQMRCIGIVRNISIYRIHTSNTSQSMTITDSIPVDSANTNSTKPITVIPNNNKNTRLTPDQLRKQTTDRTPDIKIKAAPDVRTPNSIGPRRRVVRKK